jgi:hypothetical protein
MGFGSFGSESARARFEVKLLDHTSELLNSEPDLQNRNAIICKIVSQFKEYSGLLNGRTRVNQDVMRWVTNSLIFVSRIQLRLGPRNQLRIRLAKLRSQAVLMGSMRNLALDVRSCSMARIVPCSQHPALPRCVCFALPSDTLPFPRDFSSAAVGGSATGTVHRAQPSALKPPDTMLGCDNFRFRINIHPASENAIHR